MNLLSKRNIKATFYMVGKVMEEHPEFVETIRNEGHEIGCHTYSHPYLFKLTPPDFEIELQKCIALGNDFNITYKSFRAPYFSIDTRNLWALDMLKQYGFETDSSIYPGDNKRGGIPNYTKDIHQLDNGMWEFPVSTFKIYKYEFGIGGAYFRILPYAYFRKRVREFVKTRPAVFYIHPWEVDDKHPVLSGLSPRVRLPHYFNLSKTRERLERLVDDFEFTTLGNVMDNHRKAWKPLAV